MIKWTEVKTFNNFPFRCFRTNKGYGSRIILTESGRRDNSFKPLTHSMNEVLWHFMSIAHLDDSLNDAKFYEWSNTNGLLELSYELRDQRDYWARDEHNIINIKWKHLSNNLDMFETLFCK